MLALGADILSRGGYEVISASTIDDAISLVSRFDPQLVLLDGNFAEAHLLEDLGRSTVRPLSIIFTFQEGLGATLMRMLDLNVASPLVEVIGFVEKPFAADVLMTTVAEGVRAAIEADDDKNPFEATQRIFTAAREDITQVSQIVHLAVPQPRAESSGLLYRALGLEPPESLGEPLCEALADSRTEEPELPHRSELLPVAEDEEPVDVSRAYRLAERICAMMPDRYPLHPAQMCAIASACEEALREEPPPPLPIDRNVVAEGSLGGVPAFQVLQLAENLGQTVVCRFTAPDSTIEIWIRERHVVWARDRNRIEETEQLVFDVLSWTEGRFAVSTNVVLPQSAERSGVSLPLAALLLEGLSRIDEWKRDLPLARVNSHA